METWTGEQETPRLRLEPWGREEHTEALVELNGDPEVTRFLGGPVARERSVEMSASLTRQWEEHGFGLWAVVEKATGRVAGFDGICLATWHPEFADRVEVGWRLARWAWGHGYATEAARKGLEAGWSRGLDEIIAFVDPGNTRSLAVTERLGMRPAGDTFDPRSDAPLLLFSIARP